MRCESETGRSSRKLNLLQVTQRLVGVSAVNIIVSLLRQKMIAVMLGVSGMGVYGVLMTSYSLISTVVMLGTNITGVKYLAGENLRFSAKKTKELLLLIAILSGSFFFVLCNTVIFFLGGILKIEDILYKSILVVLTAFIVSPFHSLMVTILNGEQDTSRYVKISICGALIGLCILFLFVSIFGVFGLAFGIVIAPIAIVLLGVDKISVIRVSFSRDAMSSAVSLVKESYVLLLNPIFAPLSMFIVVQLIRVKYGLEMTGIYYAAVGLTGVVINQILSSIAAGYYPRLCEQISDPRKISSTYSAQFSILFPLMLVALCGYIVWGELIIDMLFSQNFSDAFFIAGIILVGNLIKIYSWGFSIILLAKMKKKELFCGEVILFVCYISLASLTIGEFALVGVAASYAISYLVYFTVMCIFSRDTFVSVFWFLIGHVTLLFVCAGVALVVSHSGMLGWKVLLSIGLGVMVCVQYSSLKKNNKHG